MTFYFKMMKTHFSPGVDQHLGVNQQYGVTPFVVFFPFWVLFLPFFV